MCFFKELGVGRKFRENVKKAAEIVQDQPRIRLKVFEKAFRL